MTPLVSTTEEDLFPTRDEFTDWLRRKGTAPCGVPTMSAACPLATYLREEKKIPAYIHDEYWCPDTNHIMRREYTLPHWAVLFIIKVDKSIARGMYSVVTGADALAILEGI